MVVSMVAEAEALAATAAAVAETAAGVMEMLGFDDDEPRKVKEENEEVEVLEVEDDIDEDDGLPLPFCLTSSLMISVLSIRWATRTGLMPLSS